LLDTREISSRQVNLYPLHLGYLRLTEEVCAVCYRFLGSIYDKKRMKSVKESKNASGQCKSIYHKKLTDSYKS
jgi:hypothetical protein